jgi:hypothetical protein
MGWDVVHVRTQARIQGRVAVTAFELRRGVPGRLITTAPSTGGDGRAVQAFAVVAGDWTADGTLYYVDVVHSFRSVAYIVQVSDDHTGEDIWPERVNRRIDLDKCRIWLAYVPAACTIIIA